MVSQLRVFTIAPGKLDDFVKGWQNGVYALRLKHGYGIDAAWVNRERNEFGWILSYDGPEDWETKDAAYYASAERAALDPDPAQFIDQVQRWFIEPALPARK